MRKKPFLIGITGGSGVGKTTLINQLKQQFNNRITVITLDNYYKSVEEQVKDPNGKINFDLPSALNIENLKTDLQLLIRGENIIQKVYGFNNPDVNENLNIIEPKSVIIIEGLFVFYYDFISELLDYKVFVTADKEIQLQRRLLRDKKERNYGEQAVLYQWENHVIPAFKNYILPFKDEVHLTITNNNDFDENLEVLYQIIDGHLNKVT